MNLSLRTRTGWGLLLLVVGKTINKGFDHEVRVYIVLVPRLRLFICDNTAV